MLNFDQGFSNHTMSLPLCTDWSTRDDEDARSLDEIREDLSTRLSSLGFETFMYTGMPYRIKDDLNAPPASRLVKMQHFADAKATLTSSPEEFEQQKFYMSQLAKNDNGFQQCMNFSSPTIFKPARGDHSKVHHGTKSVRSILVWFMKESCPLQWGCMYALKSSLSPVDLKERMKDIKPSLKHTLLLFHLELMSDHRQLFNPYTQQGIFSENALRVIQETAIGRSSKEIAAMLGISERGVDYHINYMRDKLGARNRMHLIQIANSMEITSMSSLC